MQPGNVGALLGTVKRRNRFFFENPQALLWLLPHPIPPATQGIYELTVYNSCVFTEYGLRQATHLGTTPSKLLGILGGC